MLELALIIGSLVVKINQTRSCEVAWKLQNLKGAVR